LQQKAISNVYAQRSRDFNLPPTQFIAKNPVGYDKKK
jgi:hypothetical protein